MIIGDLWAAAYRHGVPNPDEAINAYIAVGTLNANDRTVLDGLAEASQGAGSQLRYARARFGTRALQVAWICYTDGIGGTGPPGVN